MNNNHLTGQQSDDIIKAGGIVYMVKWTIEDEGNGRMEFTPCTLDQLYATEQEALEAQERMANETYEDDLGYFGYSGVAGVFYDIQPAGVAQYKGGIVTKSQNPLLGKCIIWSAERGAGAEAVAEAKAAEAQRNAPSAEAAAA